MYLKVPLVNGTAQVDYSRVRFMYFLAEADMCLCDMGMLNGVAEIESWGGEVISEDEFLTYCGVGTVSADKSEIKADGVDRATITAVFPRDIGKCSFCFPDSRLEVPVAPADDGKFVASVQITATTPGVVRCCVGNIILPDRKNEVTIHALEAS